jgi:RsiW-degrading membrane proteinase PrsW (M82 family)
LRVLPGEAARADARGAVPLVEPRLLGGARVAPIAQEVTSIGRGLQNDIVLVDRAISREHARLFLRQDGWWIENRSAHSTLTVEGEAVPRGARVAVPVGGRMVLGQTTLQLVAPQLAGDTQETLILDQLSTGFTALPAGKTGILSPGVTLQFALKGRIGPRRAWALAGSGLLLSLLCVLLTAGTVALIGQNALARGGLGQVLAAATIPLISALGVAAVVFLLDRYEREPVLVLLGAFLWGAVIAIPPVLFVERVVSGALLPHLQAVGTWGRLARALAQAGNAGVTEEAIKGAGLVLLLWALRDEFDNVTDGAIYGALIGAGFAMVENFAYFAASPRGALGFVIVGRIVLGWLSHSTFTACFGVGLGFAREAARGQRGRWLAPLVGFAAALALHTLFDWVAFGLDALTVSGTLARVGALALPGAVLLEYGPLFVAEVWLLRIVLGSLEREAEVVREYLAGEVMGAYVTPDEYTLLQHAQLRSSAERFYALRYGARAYLTARAFYQTATGLAFRKWHVAQGDAPKPTARQPEDAYRARIGRLRRSLQRQVRAGP